MTKRELSNDQRRPIDPYSPSSAGGKGSGGAKAKGSGKGSGAAQGDLDGWSSRPPGNMGAPAGPSPSRQQEGKGSGKGAAHRSPKPTQQTKRGLNEDYWATKKERARPNSQPPKVTNSEAAGKDTVIGRGFTAAMRRGVASAKPTAKEDMLPQQKEDGGFVATIQRGFEGLFGGRPTSKEEVLRNRGPVVATEYEAVPGDEIDQRVQYYARELPDDVGGCVKIWRDKRGEYMINDERVFMEWKYRQGQDGQTEKEIFVSWQTEEGEQPMPEPLQLFLQHTSNVAYEVKQGGNVITQVPSHARMSFDEVGTKVSEGSADARFNAMEVAARQAKIREEKAMEWRERNGPIKEEGELAVNAPFAMHAPPTAAVPMAAMPPTAPMAAAPMYPMVQRPSMLMSMSGIGVTAMAGGGYAPMQRQGTMYAYGTGYSVPVR